MKSLFCIFFIFIICACAVAPTENQQDATDQELNFETTEEGEYDIIVFDPMYQTFLQTRAWPMEFYSEVFYRNKNIFMVNEWNNRFMQPQRYDRDLYMVRINYNPQIDYGLEFEYKLYNFFMFVEWKYGVDLDGSPLRIR